MTWPPDGGDGPDGPEGTPYDWYRRAVTLLDGGNPDAAAVLLERLREVDPTSTAVLETHARALFAAYGADFTMVPSRIVAQECIAILTTPLLAPRQLVQPGLCVNVGCCLQGRRC